MALNIGELVGIIRADDSGWRSGLAAAHLRMQGFTRDADGRLRDLHGRFVRQGDSMGRALGDRITRGATLAVGALKKIAPAVAGIGAGLPAVAAVGAALGGLAAGAVAAGLAVTAFKLAVAPQMEAVTNVADLAAKAEEAAAEGGEKAAAATKAYQDALAKLTPAAQTTAKSFIGLKSDYKSWSDGLSSTTMPLVTRGIEILRDLLPTLTPFVKAAAGALGDMLDRVAIGVKSAGFKEWAADMAAAAGPALRDFIAAIGNLGRGFMGLLQAFLPVSGQMTGGLVDMTKAFADWGTGLKGSEGLAKFLDLAGQGGDTLGALATAAIDLLVAASPLIGVTTLIATHLAEIISATPAPALKILVGVLAAVKVGMIAYSAGSAVVAAANTVMASSTYTAIAGWTRMMAVGLMAYVRIGAAAVASAAITAASWVGSALVSIGTWIAAVVRAGITAAVQFTMMAARAVAWAAVMAAQWLIAMGPIGWAIAAVIGLVALVVANWDKVKGATVAAWNAVVGKVKSAGSAIVSGVRSAVASALVAWSNFRAGVVSRAASLLAYVRSIPGRIRSGLGSLGGLLVGAGKNVIQGLWNGIKSMGGWLKSQLISFAKAMIPGPIAKALGIASPSKVMARTVGRHIPSGIVKGIRAGAPALDRTMANLVTPPSVAGMAYGGGAGGGNGAAGRRGSGQVTVRFTSDGGQVGDTLLGLVQERIQVRGGNVQAVLGAN